MADIDKYNNDENYQALRKFLLDIGCLDKLKNWTSNINIFSILKVSKTEIRHSNVLAWLLDPNENHGLENRFLTGLIRLVAPYILDTIGDYSLLLADGNDVVVEREWRNIDVVVHSASDRFVICIENKIASKEHDNQLQKYKKIIKETYPEYKQIFLYISPERDEPSDSDYWHAIGYEDISNILEEAISNANLTSEAKLIIDNYLEIIRREIVGDEELKKICNEIYTKHQKALDLIYENKQDKAMELADIIHEWARKKRERDENFIFDEDKSGKSYTRYKTTKMSEFMPDASEASSGWKTKNYYYYEIRNYEGKGFTFQLALSSKDISDELRDKCDKIYEISKTIKTNQSHPRNKKDWLWRTPLSTSKTTITQHLENDSDFKEIIFEKLDSQYNEMCRLEKELLKRLGEKEYL